MSEKEPSNELNEAIFYGVLVAKDDTIQVFFKGPLVDGEKVSVVEKIKKIILLEDHGVRLELNSGMPVFEWMVSDVYVVHVDEKNKG